MNSNAAVAETRSCLSVSESWCPLYPSGNSSGMKPVVMCPAMNRGWTIIERRNGRERPPSGFLRALGRAHLAALRDSIVDADDTLAHRAGGDAHRNVCRHIARRLIGRAVSGQGTNGGEELAQWVFRVDAALDGPSMTSNLRRADAEK
eukprot:scaffold4217_cov27-Tisochrysis_lutea.AAC.3